ncbi:MAG: GNAT family N-acetyltransferase [Chitinophagaceae bacterium]|nr:GNAT family N-acetyltransferase [Oligoflexus sp.]
MGVTYQLYHDPRHFRDLVFPFLLENEAAHCLGLGVIHSLIHKPELHNDFQLAAFFDDATAQLLGIAWVTSPQPLGVSQMPVACLPALMEFASGLNHKPSGIAAPYVLAEGFKHAWMQREACSVYNRFEQCIYELTEIQEPRFAPGRVRLANAHDVAILSRWSWSFVVECGMAKGRDKGHVNGKSYARQAVHDKSRYVWEVDGKIVAMAGVQGHTPEGIRISWVYTPPEHRCKGYASQLVARVCEEQLANGKKRCFLYTDLENPTSNHIYQELGFVPVASPLHYTFVYESR